MKSLIMILLTLVGPPCIKRDSHGRILRNPSVIKAFERATGYPNGRPGYVVDHVIPLCACGPDSVGNLQWQREDSSLVKDHREVTVCKALEAWATP